MPSTTAPTPTTADLTAAFLASGKTITVVPPANAVPPSPQSRPVATAKTTKRVKKAIAKIDAKPAAKTRAVKRPAAPAEKSVAVAGNVTLASICTALNVAPKSARAVLRRHMTKPADGWSFDAATAKRVRALLTK